MNASPCSGSIVTFVHGTWARGSRWPEVEISLRDSLPQPVVFEYFKWSGWNSVIGRGKAAKALSGQLRKQLNEHPAAYHCVIAHSHGGNIVIKALADEDIQRGVDRVICMSTPFLAADYRLVDPLAMAIAGPILPSALVSLWLLTEPRGFGLLENWLPLIFTLYCWAALTLYSDYKSAEIIETLSLGSLSELAPKTLILRTSADEVSMTFSSVQVFSWLTARLWQRLHRLCEWAVKPIATPLRLVLTVLGTNLVALSLGVLLGADEVGALFMLAILLYLLPFILLSALLPVTALLLVPFGGLSLMLGGPKLLISADPTPPGQWIVMRISAMTNSAKLRHSLSYQQPEAVDAIQSWLGVGGNIARMQSMAKVM